MTMSESNPYSSQHDSTGTRELDLPIGWYEFPVKAGEPSPVFDYVNGEVWHKETDPPKPDARVVFSSEADFSVEYRCFGQNLRSEYLVCMTWHVRTTKALGLNNNDLRFVSKWQKEASTVIRKCFQEFVSTLARKKNGTVDRQALVAKVENLLNAAPDRSLLEANTDWIFEGLAHTIHQIYRGSCEFFGLLFERYKQMGGMDDRRDFRVCMGLLLHLYRPAAGLSKLAQPDQTNWRSERQILNCWEGMAQTRKDALRYLEVMRNYCCLTGPNIVPRKVDGF
jgi:hypothetical protein